MTGLARGTSPRILRGHRQNFVFMITLLYYDPRVLRRLVNISRRAEPRIQSMKPQEPRIQPMRRQEPKVQKGT